MGVLNRTKPCVFYRRSGGQAAFLQALPCLYRFFPLSKLPSAGLPGLYLYIYMYIYIYYIDGCHGYLPSITPKGIHGFVFDLSIFGSFFGTSNILGRCVQTSVFLRQAMPVSGFKSVGWLMIMHKGCTTYITLAIINIIIHHHNITIHNIYMFNHSYSIIFFIHQPFSCPTY